MKIIDAVFREPERRCKRRAAFGLALAFCAHGGIWFWAQNSEVSLEFWSADLAARVHAELTRENFVDTTPPAPVPPPVTKVTRKIRPPPPAQAAAVIAAPVDLTQEKIVTDFATAYVGGVSSFGGTNVTAVHSDVDPNAKPHDGSNTVTLEDSNWNCPWPRDAEADPVRERFVVLRVVVGTDGAVESAKIITDPGLGFGPAALECAKRTRFSPALDPHGDPIKAESPPIRVRFTR